MMKILVMSIAGLMLCSADRQEELRLFNKILADAANRNGSEFNLIEVSKNKDNVTVKYILPEQVYQKGYLYSRGSKELKHMTFEQVVQHINYLEKWVAPKEIINDFPYFLAGYDYDDRPIWMAEGGKFNVKKWVIRGGKDLENLQKYMFQAGIRILKSIAARDRPGHEVTEGVFFGDADGFDVSQAYHLPTVRFVLTEALRWRDMAVQAMGRLIIVNMSYQLQQGLEFARPIAGKLMERVETFGTNKAKWIPELRRLLPVEAIPSWYGGSKSFKPLLAFG